jgi:hypothetical protein
VMQKRLLSSNVLYAFFFNPIFYLQAVVIH